MQSELVDVVDKDDKVLKTIQRKDEKDSDILRVTSIFILNKKGKILLQLRSKKCLRYPLYWDSTGGHLTSGEDYAEAAKREMFEEIGVKTALTFLGKDYIELPDGRRHINANFKGTYDGQMKIDPNEVERVQFFSLEEVRKMISRRKVHPECVFGLKKYFLFSK